MDLVSSGGSMAIGFLVWVTMAPRLGKPGYGERFAAYMTALSLCLFATGEIIMVKPLAFFFTIGGFLAFLCVTVRLTLHLNFHK